MLRLLVTLTFGLFPYQVQSFDNKVDPNTLFKSSTPLEFVLQMDMEKVLNDTSADPQYSTAFLILTVDEKNKHPFNISVKARGTTRRVDICDFPPLKINFQKKSTKHTVFEGQDKIKMVTHCKESDKYQNFALLEYLIYKFYNTLTNNSYRVRMVNIVYRDINQEYPDISRSGFMIEDDDQLAKRVGGAITDKKIWSADSCENFAVDVFTLFQFMIGNTDWWIQHGHNVDLVGLSNDKFIPIPFDFDCAGLINPPHAKPSPHLPINEVRDRFFKSSCSKKKYFNDYEPAIKLFNKNKNTILSMLENATFLDKWYRKSSVKYISDFYEIINDPDEFNKYISQNCEYINTPPNRVPKRK